MLTIINLLVILAIPWVFGLFILSLVFHKGEQHFNFWEKLALSFSFGLGFLVIIMFLLALLKVSLTFGTILATILVISVICGALLIYRKTFLFSWPEVKANTQFNFKSLGITEKVLVCLISLKVVYCYFESLIKPLTDVDAFQYYSIVAKAVFYSHTIFSPYIRSFMGEKPPFTFLAQSWAFMGLQGTNDALFKVLTPTLFLCLIIIFYFALRKFYEKKISLLFTFLLSTLPFIVYHVSTAYSDFSVTFYYSVGTIYLYLSMKYLTAGNKGVAYNNLIISFVLLAISVWIKIAALILASINLFVFFAFLLFLRNKGNLKLIFIPLVVFVLIISPWILQGKTVTFTRMINSIIYQLHPRTLTANTVPPLSSSPSPPTVSSPAKLPIIISIFARKLFLYADWHLTWALFLLGIVVFYKQSFRRPLYFLLIIIAIDLLSLLVQFEGENFLWLQDGTLFDRLAMNEVPVVLYFCAEAIIPGLKEHFEEGGNRASSKSKKGS